MLLDGIPPEAELQPDLDVGTPLGVKLQSALEVIAGEASPAAGRLRGLAARGTDDGLCDADLGSDLADRHGRAGQIENLLLLRRADRTAGRVADAAGCRGLARLLGRRYASRARFRSHLTRNETLAAHSSGSSGQAYLEEELGNDTPQEYIARLMTGATQMLDDLRAFAEKRPSQDSDS